MREYYFDPKQFFIDPIVLKTRYSIWGYSDLEMHWYEFINEDLTHFIDELNKHIKAIKPDIELSVAVKADYLTARNEFYQEWMNWLNSGLVDFVCLMAYTKDIKPILDKTLVAVKEPHRITVGLGLYLLSPIDIKKQVSFVNTLPVSGVVFFSYEEVKKNKNYLKALR